MKNDWPASASAAAVEKYAENLQIVKILSSTVRFTANSWNSFSSRQIFTDAGEKQSIWDNNTYNNYTYKLKQLLARSIDTTPVASRVAVLFVDKFFLGVVARSGENTRHSNRSILIRLYKPTNHAKEQKHRANNAIKRFNWITLPLLELSQL